MAIEHFLMETHTHIHAITHKSIFIDSIDVRLFVICLHSISPIVSCRVCVFFFSCYFFSVLFHHHRYFINFIIVIVHCHCHRHHNEPSSFDYVKNWTCVRFLSFSLSVFFLDCIYCYYFPSIHSFVRSNLICNSSLQFLIHTYVTTKIYLMYLYIQYKTI